MENDIGHLHATVHDTNSGSLECMLHGISEGFRENVVTFLANIFVKLLNSCSFINVNLAF